MTATCRRISELLARRGQKLVLAESCTAGLVAASLASVPGISEHFCGSAVTYRDGTKEAWLRVPRKILNDPGAVSELVARMMAEHTLAITPEADWAASVTGHLGPHAPRQLDGVVFVGIASRHPDKTKTDVLRFRLTSTTRTARQREAALRVLTSVQESLKAGEYEDKKT